MCATSSRSFILATTSTLHDVLGQINTNILCSYANPWLSLCPSEHCVILGGGILVNARLNQLYDKRAESIECWAGLNQLNAGRG